MSRLHYGSTLLMWLEFCISVNNGVSRWKRRTYMKKEKTDKFFFGSRNHISLNCISFLLLLPATLWPVWRGFSIFSSQLCTSMHRSLLGKGSDAEGTVTHHHEVCGALVFHFPPLVIVTVPAVKLLHFSFSLRSFCICHRPAKMSSVHIYSHVTLGHLLCTPDIFLAFINFLSISSTIYLPFKGFNNWKQKSSSDSTVWQKQYVPSAKENITLTTSIPTVSSKTWVCSPHTCLGMNQLPWNYRGVSWLPYLGGKAVAERS